MLFRIRSFLNVTDEVQLIISGGSVLRATREIAEYLIVVEFFLQKPFGASLLKQPHMPM